MPKKKLTAKLKASLKKDYRRVKQADFSGEALKYLKRVRAAHKGQKTKKKKGTYEKKISRRKTGLLTYEAMISALAKGKKMSVAKYKKKYAKELLLLQNFGEARAWMECELLAMEIQFNPRAGTMVNSHRVKRGTGIFEVLKLKRTILSTGLTYDKIEMLYGVTQKEMYNLFIPEYDKSEIEENPKEWLDNLLDTGRVRFWFKPE